MWKAVAAFRLSLPNKNWCLSSIPESQQTGVPRWLLSAPWSTSSNDDLRTAAGHYIFQKPIK